jgi:hypothetical protein
MANLTQKFKSWLAMKTEDCKNISPLFSYALDRKLKLTERLRLKIHLYTCSACLNYASNLKFMHEVFHIQDEQIEAEKPHVTLRNDAKERMKKALKSHQ